MNYREAIKKKRKKLGLNQSQLADLAGITQPFVNEIERGKKSPSVDVLIRICDALNIDLMVDRD